MGTAMPNLRGEARESSPANSVGVVERAAGGRGAGCVSSEGELAGVL